MINKRPTADFFWSTEACWQISLFPIDWNAERCINGAQDIFSVQKRRRSDKSHGSQSYQMHIIDKLKNYSRLFLSTEACWQISRFSVALNADRSMDEAQDIIM